MIRWAVGALVGLVVLAAGTHPAGAVNLVTNGDFETGTLAGWSLTGDTGATGINESGNPPHGGQFQMSFGASSDSIFMQSAQLMTTPGALCQFTFWLRNSDEEGDNSFSASWDNGAPLVNLVDAGPFDYVQYTFTVIGTGSDNITFRARNPPAYYDLDDVSVDCPPAAPAPALSSASLAGLGLMLVVAGVWCTRKRSRAAA